MKKIIAMLMAVLMVLSLTACGDNSDTDIQPPDDVGGNSSTGDDQKETQNAPAKQDVTITETVLVDEAGVKITAKSLDTNSLFGPEIKLLIENNSGKDLTFQTRHTSVNGYMIETMMSAEVVNGKKSNEGLTFLRSDLEACGIETIADMEFSFHIFTTEGWKDYLDTPQIQIKTSAADSYTYTFDDSGDVAYDEKDVKIVIKGLSQDDSIIGPGVVVYIENNSEKAITVQTRDVSINGFMVDAMFSCEVMPGKRAVDSITFMSSDLEENNITGIENVELSFHIFDSASWSTLADTNVVTISFK
jgi:predicted small lipoprotein YifL